EASARPSGLNATDSTAPRWPSPRVARGAGAWAGAGPARAARPIRGGRTSRGRARFSLIAGFPVKPGCAGWPKRSGRQAGLPVPSYHALTRSGGASASLLGWWVRRLLAEDLQVLTGVEPGRDNAVHGLDAEAWQQRRQRLEERGGPL